MKFAQKLFLWMTILLGVIFTCFGMWMLHSHFSQMLTREIQRGEQESQMFQYLFEMGYRTNEEYGEIYAVNRTLDSIVGNIEKSGSHCFVLDEQQTYLYGSPEEDCVRKWLGEMVASLDEEHTYAYAVRRSEGKQYLMLSVCVSHVGDAPVYLGMSRDIGLLYQDRERLISRYRLALLSLLLLGGGCIYLLARYITAPLRSLKRVAGDIAAGDYSRRSHISANDEIGELSESFNQMANALLKQVQEREDFTAAFAHELKTPLTSIIGYADMLNTLKLSEEECREAYYYIYSQGKRLESLSHKLLELVSLEKHEIPMVPNSTKALARNILTTMRPVWKKKDIKGKVLMEKGSIYGDEELLLSLFYNLLDNAVKAVEPGGFVLMKGTGTDNGYEVKIIDNGRGIPEEEISRITEAFYMVDKSRSRKEGGAGIGMALCKRIIELHKGTFMISSKPGMGTVIHILFPLTPDPSKEKFDESLSEE